MARGGGGCMMHTRDWTIRRLVGVARGGNCTTHTRDWRIRRLVGVARDGSCTTNWRIHRMVGVARNHYCGWCSGVHQMGTLHHTLGEYKNHQRYHHLLERKKSAESTSSIHTRMGWMVGYG